MNVRTTVALSVTSLSVTRLEGFRASVEVLSVLKTPTTFLNSGAGSSAIGKMTIH